MIYKDKKGNNKEEKIEEGDGQSFSRSVKNQTERKEINMAESNNNNNA